MALYVIADLHLSSDRSKSMAIFGDRWKDHMEKLRRNWNAVVEPADTVVLPGDISWALRMEDSEDDFRFLNALNGQKLVGKGNHDFWFSTNSKVSAFWKAHGFDSLHILYNNAYLAENCVVCGSRGWFTEETQQHTKDEVDYAKIVNREVVRLRMSLNEAVRLREADGGHLPIIPFLHFPPVWNGIVCREIMDVLHDFRIRICYFGHIHGAYYAPPVSRFEEIDFVLCAADYLHFTPIPVRLPAEA